MLMLAAVILMLALLAIGSHVAVALGLVTTGLILTMDGVPMTVVAQTAFKAVNSYPLMAVPMFILAGNLMMRGNIAGLMIDLIGSIVRAVQGGLALTVMIACVFFAAISGSSVGSAAAIGAATVDGLKREEYPARFAAGIVAVGGTLGLMLPPSLGFILIGSIYTGYLTPTEVSAFAAVYAAVLCLVVYRSVTVGGAWTVLRDSVLQTTMIFAVVMGGSLVGFVLARMGVSARIVEYIVGIDMTAWQFLLVANAILLILGMFLDGVAMIVLTSPLLFPVATALGIDPVHFAVVMVANVEIATLTPPIGLNLFVMSGIARIPLHEVVRGVIPFYAVRLCGLMLITYIPAISLVLL